MFFLSVLLATAKPSSDGFTLTAPIKWSSQSVQQRQRNGWILLKTYSFRSATGPESIEVSRGPLRGLSIADDAYLEVEGIKHDMPDVEIEVDHEQKMCGGTGWVLIYRYFVSDKAERVYETLVSTERGSYRAVYAHPAASAADARAIAALDSLCPQ